jgi:hypothetical protein
MASTNVIVVVLVFGESWYEVWEVKVDSEIGGKEWDMAMSWQIDNYANALRLCSQCHF